MTSDDTVCTEVGRTLLTRMPCLDQLDSLGRRSGAWWRRSGGGVRLLAAADVKVGAGDPLAAG